MLLVDVKVVDEKSLVGKEKWNIAIRRLSFQTNLIMSHKLTIISLTIRPLDYEFSQVAKRSKCELRLQLNTSYFLLANSLSFGGQLKLYKTTIS